VRTLAGVAERGPDAELTKDVDFIVDRLAVLGLIHPDDRIESEIEAIRARLRQLGADDAARNRRSSFRLIEARDSTAE
jgi:hypothetical protein